MSGSNNKSKGDNMIGADQLASDLSPTREKSSRWMPSKMRLMRKMMSSSYPHEKGQQTSSGDSCCNSTSSPNGPPARVCSDCKTTKTPLWRSGPQGPKSLCNACGIRQRKARKAMAAAAASVTGGPCGKEKGFDSCNAVIPHNKRFKLEEARKKIRSEDHNINLKNNLALHPQDEKEAAILLMALSCDLIYF